MGYKISMLPTDITVSKETEDSASNEAAEICRRKPRYKSLWCQRWKLLKPKGIKKSSCFNLDQTTPRWDNLNIPVLCKRSIQGKPGWSNEAGARTSLYRGRSNWKCLKKEPCRWKKDLAPKQLCAIKRKQKRETKAGKITTLEAAATAMGWQTDWNNWQHTHQRWW